MPDVPVWNKPKPAIPERTIICVRNGKTVKMSAEQQIGEQAQRFLEGVLKRRKQRGLAK